MIVRMKSFFFYSNFFLCVTFVVSFLWLFLAIASPGQALQRNSAIRQGRCCHWSSHCLRASRKTLDECHRNCNNSNGPCWWICHWPRRWIRHMTNAKLETKTNQPFKIFSLNSICRIFYSLYHQRQFFVSRQFFHHLCTHQLTNLVKLWQFWFPYSFVLDA